MSPKLSKISIAVMSVLFAGVAVAADVQQQSNDKQNNAAGVINAGGFEIRPTLSLAIGKNDNVGLASAGKTSSNFTKLSPKVSVEMPTQGQVYSATYSGTYANYTGSTVDNYYDHGFGLAAKNDWSTRVNSVINVDYNKGHDGRNALPNANTFKQLWHTTGVKGMVHYGADGAQGQFELTAGQVAKRYDTNNGGTNLPGTGTSLFNNDATSLMGAFFYKVAPATHMIVQAGTTSFSYLDAASKIHDSKEQQYMVGVKWDATAKTTGSVKVGKVNKTFNLGTFPSASATAWDANVTWSPLTYSVVNVSLSQKAAESYGVGSSLVSQDSNVDWTHGWSNYIKSKLSFGDGVDTYQAINQVNKRQTYGAKLSYEVNRWLNAGVEYQNTKRNSTNPVLTYTQNITMLVLDGTL